jgi:hypothetical protein
MPAVSWPKERRTRTMERKPREEERWREVLERPRGVVSGFWRRRGWDFRMRVTRRGSLRWIARRRRREGSILGELVVLLDGEGEDMKLFAAVESG